MSGVFIFPKGWLLSLILAAMAIASVSESARASSTTNEIVLSNVYVTVYTGMVIMTGHVSVSEGSPSDCMVFFWGDIHGNATVMQNGHFVVSAPFAGTYGEAVIVAGDQNGNLSDPVYIELMK